MSYYIGIDIGGTKIAAALFDADFQEVTQHIRATPDHYAALLQTCVELVQELDHIAGEKPSVGIGIPGAIDHVTGVVTHAANTQALVGQPFESDLRQRLGRAVVVGNDADCAALSEAVMGAGQGRRSVFALIIGTGVGGGLVANGKLVVGANGLAGEIGHLPLPYREAADGPTMLCACGQYGCIDKSISGPSLTRLYRHMTGKPCQNPDLVAMILAGDAEAARVLGRYFTVVAKAFVTIVHAYDPELIVVSGGLNNLPGFYEQVPQRLSHYTAVKKLRVQIVPAMNGAMSGLRGAALLLR